MNRAKRRKTNVVALWVIIMNVGSQNRSPAGTEPWFSHSINMGAINLFKKTFADNQNIIDQEYAKAEPLHILDHSTTNTR